MTRARQNTGRAGERLVAEMLESAGWQLVARNARTRAGELDLIALERSTLVFVEVKTLRPGASVGPERPVLAIGPRKRAQVRRLAREWLASSRPGGLRFEEIRFDAIGVLLAAGGRPEVEHLRGAF